eukprot:gnl/TRDRNA2_/TRDRNA2_174635_c0_seq1.p1 gnl/TRDRNA2_/TRDRNA2_174635_c0~~gnl/TRDRNA2_/TRDRNA2_174635_c0_seq1.p1  ORF type:complete len:162 (+),score=0.42 gnl/TRDRNA2_/TRDRNA2_174635_c0_seq1:108-593(+)
MTLTVDEIKVPENHNESRMINEIEKHIFKVFIFGLDWWITESDIEKTFVAYDPKNIDFGIDKINGRSKGWLTFEVSSEAVVEEIVAKFNRSILYSKKVFVCAANQHSITKLLLSEAVHGYMEDFQEAWEMETRLFQSLLQYFSRALLYSSKHPITKGTKRN